MEFTKEHLIKIDSMNAIEAKVFVLFLETEILRHREDILNAQELINRVILKFGEESSVNIHKCAFSKGDVGKNVRRACLAGDEILKKGHIPFIPHLTHLWHLISPKHYNEWLVIDLMWVNQCDAVLRLSGESAGADKEVAYAMDAGIPIYFRLEDIPLDN